MGDLFPGSPPKERRSIAEHACTVRSGRVGFELSLGKRVVIRHLRPARSAAAKRLEDSAIELAVQAHVRHAHSNYDELLAGGMERHEARANVADIVGRILHSWSIGGRW